MHYHHFRDEELKEKVHKFYTLVVTVNEKYSQGSQSHYKSLPVSAFSQFCTATWNYFLNRFSTYRQYSRILKPKLTQADISSLVLDAAAIKFAHLKKHLV